MFEGGRGGAGDADLAACDLAGAGEDERLGAMVDEHFKSRFARPIFWNRGSATWHSGLGRTVSLPRVTE